MEGFSTWPTRDILFIVMAVFNAGIVVGGIIALIRFKRILFENHLKHIGDTLKRIEKKICGHGDRLDKHGERIATLEGKINERTRKEGLGSLAC
jgi:hypothetical protein